MLQHAIGASQRIMMNLRPPVLGQGLVAAVKWLSENFERRTGVAVQLRSLAPAIDVPADLQLVAYRTAQEALTNAGKYAGARQVRIDLSDEGVLTVEVSDDGCGFAAEARSKPKAFGLRASKSARAHRGGWLDVSSRPGQGHFGDRPRCATIAFHRPHAPREHPVIHVVLCDDHAVLRRGIRDTLLDDPDIEVTAKAGGYSELREALRRARALRRAAAGHQHARPQRPEVLASLRETHPGIRVLIVSMYRRISTRCAASRPARTATANKAGDPTHLAAAVHTLAQGRKYLTPEVAQLLANSLADPRRRCRMKPCPSASCKRWSRSPRASAFRTSPKS